MNGKGDQQRPRLIGSRIYRKKHEHTFKKKAKDKKIPTGYRAIIVGDGVYWWKVSECFNDLKQSYKILTVYDSKTMEKKTINTSQLPPPLPYTLGGCSGGTVPSVVKEYILKEFSK